VEFPVRPLSFAEFLRFKDIPLPKRPRLAGDPAPLQHAVGDYLQWGGFPEVVLAEDERRKEALLKQYFDDVLFKDVAMRHEVRDVPTLRSLAVYLLTQTASRISF
jgi:predicted AAA+ superfamily ATPase